MHFRPRHFHIAVIALAATAVPVAGCDDGITIGRARDGAGMSGNSGTNDGGGAGRDGGGGTPDGGPAGVGGSDSIHGGGGTTGGGGGGTSGVTGAGGSGNFGTGGAAGVILECSDPTFADCTSAPGCETMLGTDTDCAGCGDRSCAIANALFSCSSANGCTRAVCAVGFANCDRTSPDCEAIIAEGASCLPAYRGSVGVVTFSYNSAAAAIATDGSFFFGGTFTGTVNFGTPAAPDVRTVAAPGDVYGFITRFNSDGSYGWTRAFPGSGGPPLVTGIAPMAVNSLAAAADGGVVAVGSYAGTIDLDPGNAVESHQTMRSEQQESFVAKLAADGSFAWGGTFASQGIDSSGNAGGVVIDGAGAVYVAGWYAGEVDLDPSAGTEVHTSRSFGDAAVAGALVKLTPAGKLSWVQSVDTGPSVPPGGSITLATDGAIWILADVDEGGAAVAAYEPNGTPRGYWAIGTPISSLTWPHSIASGLNGCVYIGGGAWGFPDLDPGPGVARRLLGTSLAGGFIVKLGSDGRYLWDQTIAGGEVFAVAGAPDGGVIGLGLSGAIGNQSVSAVTKLNADGTAGWRFSSGNIHGTVVSSGTTFVVTGSNIIISSGTDMDPGPGVDIVGASTLYLSRFNF